MVARLSLIVGSVGTEAVVLVNKHVNESKKNAELRQKYAGPASNTTRTTQITGGLHADVVVFFLHTTCRLYRLQVSIKDKVDIFSRVNRHLIREGSFQSYELRLQDQGKETAA
jgi:hypothetical protein